MKVTGQITKVLDKQTGTSKDGKEWVKQSFILQTEEKYNNKYYFEVFGSEKVENFEKYNKIGDNVEVEFNVQTNEWQGKYYTSLQAWLIKKVDAVNDAINNAPFKTIPANQLNEDDDSGLSF